MTYSNSNFVKPNNICDYIAGLDRQVIDQLYRHSSANCLAVLRELPLLGKHYVLRLLFVVQPIPQAVINSWVIPDSIKEHNEVTAKLKALCVWSESPMPGGLPGFILNDVFRNNLKIALLGGGSNWALIQTNDVDKYARDAAFVNKYALDRWECILQFMVGNRTEQISTDTIKTLINAGYIDYDVNKTNVAPKITANGFQFLLMSTNAQVWYFILHYLDTIEAKGFNFVECLSFLFQLSFSAIGKDYSMDGLSENILGFLQNLREFGFIYQRRRKYGRFYPTRLVVNLTSSLKDEIAANSEDGYLIVETNYRVYAYTDSPLQIALLSLFVDLKYRFPKFCLGLLTRDSVRRALRSGITADQMINFLNINLHPDMSNDKSKKRHIPPTVTDQVKLWEIERDRFTFKDGVLYSQFLSQNDFELLRNYASDCNHLIWDYPAKRVMVVTNNGHDDVRRFWKRHKMEHYLHETTCYLPGYKMERAFDAAPQTCGIVISDTLMSDKEILRLRELAQKITEEIGYQSYSNRESINLKWMNLHKLFRIQKERKNVLKQKDYELIKKASENAKLLISEAFGLPHEKLGFYLVSQFTRYRQVVPFSEFRHVDKVRSPGLVVTSILWLSTVDLDFGGGRTEFLVGGPEPFTPLMIEPKLGRFAAWTSGYENPHGVMGLNYGDRLALIFAFSVNPNIAYKTMDDLRNYAEKAKDIEY